MTDWTDGFGNVPYDPDMTVAEALDLGLIAVMDTGVIGRTWDGPCGYEYIRKDERSYTCMRNKGHAGPHARVLRWTESWQDIEGRENAMRAAEARAEREKRRAMAEKADLSKRMADLQRAVKRAEEAQAKQMKKAFDALEEKRMQRAWEGVPRNFRDHTAGKIRGPKR